jgi:O-antigen/teichoic acid export membrane protein
MTTHQAPALQTSGQAPDPSSPATTEDGHAPSPASRMVRNALALSFARPLTWAAAIGMTILLPRYLGDVNLGKVNFAFAFADWCGLLASLGISTYLTKEVASRAKGAGSLILNALLLRLVLALGVGSLAMVLASLLDYDELTRQLVYLLSAHMLLTVIAGVLVGALQGMQHLKAVAVIDSLSKVAQLGLVAAVIFADYGPIGVAVAFVISDAIAIVAFTYAVWQHGGFNGRPELRTWWSLTRGGVPFLIWETALLTYARVDVIIMAMFAHAAVLGWYNAAYRIISIPLFFPVIVMTVTFPALSAAANDLTLFRSIARRAVQTVVLVTVPAALGLMILADKLIEFLGYPESFAGSVAPIVLLATTLPLVAVNMIVGSALAAQDRQRQWAIAGVGAAILNPALNLLAIPYTQTEFGNAGIGAAAVTAFTEVYLLVAGQYFLPRGIFDHSTVVDALKCLLAGLAMAAVVWLIRDLPILLSVPVGVLVYGGGSLLLGTVSLGDVRRVRGYLIERRAAPAMNAA